MTNAALKTFLQQPSSTATRHTLLHDLFAEGLTEFTQARILTQDTNNIHLILQIGTISLADGRNLGVLDVTITEAV